MSSSWSFRGKEKEKDLTNKTQQIEDEIDKLDEIILEFHNNLTHENFYNTQYANRLLWEEMLTFGGFLRTFLKEICLLNREQ